jgi:hypothetical protein
VSAERPKPVTRVSPSQIAPIRTARCEIDLSPGTAQVPDEARAARRRRSAHSLDHRRDDDAVALCLEERAPARSASPSPRDEHRQRAAALGRDVVELEVLDVDPLCAERLEDPGEHARAGLDVTPEPAAASPGRRKRAREPRRRCALASPIPREEPGVARR